MWAYPDTVSGANNLIPNAPGLPAAMPADTLTGDPLLLLGVPGTLTVADGVPSVQLEP